MDFTCTSAVQFDLSYIYMYIFGTNIGERTDVKAGLHFEQNFHNIGQKKNEAIQLARSDVTVKKKLQMYSTFFSSARYILMT